MNTNNPWVPRLIGRLGSMLQILSRLELVHETHGSSKAPAQVYKQKTCSGMHRWPYQCPWKHCIALWRSKFKTSETPISCPVVKWGETERKLVGIETWSLSLRIISKPSPIALEQTRSLTMYWAFALWYYPMRKTRTICDKTKAQNWQLPSCPVRNSVQSSSKFSQRYQASCSTSLIPLHAIWQHGKTTNSSK